MKRIGLLLLSLKLFVSCTTLYEVGTSSVSIEPTDETVSIALAGYAGPPQGRFSLTWEDMGLIDTITGMADIKEQFKKTEKFPKGKEFEKIISQTCDENKCYALTTDHFLLERDLTSSGDWKRIGYNNKETYNIDILKIACHRQKLYTLASDGHVYRNRHKTEGNLSAKAIAIRKGKKTAVIVAVDVCGLDYSFTRNVKEEISRRRGIPGEAIMINASHTHFAPTTQQWPTWGIQNQHPDSTYLNRVLYPGIIQAVENALDRMEPSYLSFGRDTTNIGYNRSLKGDQTVYDNSLDVLRITSVDRKRSSLLFLTGCHPVFIDDAAGRYTLSANFPGHARESLQQAGYEHAIFLQACAGDINPKDSSRISGKVLANDVLRCVEKEMSPIQGNIRAKTDSVLIPIFPDSKEEVLSLRNENIGKIKDIPGGCESDIPGRNVRWADRMLKHYDDKTLPATMTVYVQTLDIGDWKLIGLSREATTEYGLAIKNVWPDRKVSVIAYTNDVSGYMATDPHIRAKDYEGYESFLWYGQPSSFPLGTFDAILEYFRRQK